MGQGEVLLTHNGSVMVYHDGVVDEAPLVPTSGRQFYLLCAIRQAWLNDRVHAKLVSTRSGTADTHLPQYNCGKSRFPDNICVHTNDHPPICYPPSAISHPPR
jgi:hypothetical protein